MNSNLFDRLNAGGSFLENIYNQEELEKQAKKQALSQVKALGGLAHQQIQQAIGESGVEAAVGAAGIAFPLVKKYGGDLTKDFPSMDLGGLNQAKDSIVNSVTSHVRGLQQQAAQLQSRADEIFNGARTNALRPTGAIDRMGAEPVQPSALDPREIRNPAFDPRELDEPVVENPNRIISAAERSRILQPLNDDLEQHTRAMGGEVNRLLGDLREAGDAPNVSRISQTGRQPEPTYRLGDVQNELARKTQLLNEDKARPGPYNPVEQARVARTEAQRAGVDPLDITEDRIARLEAQDPDVPTVSIPKGERVARVAERRLARGIEEPELDRPQVMDPFQVGVEARPVEDWTSKLARNPPQAAGDYDPFQDIIDQQRFREERAAMTRDRVRAAKSRAEPQQATDYDPVQPTEKAHLRSIKPAEEPVEAQAGPAESVPPSELTGGISPASLPEGAGFARGGLKITAKRPPAEPPQIQKRGFQEAAFEQDPEEDVRSGERLEPESFTPEELFEPIKITAPPDEPEEPKVPEPEAQEEEFAKAAAPEEVAPGVAEQKAEKPEAAPEPEVKPDEPSVKAPSLDKDIGESVEKELPEETGALELPAIGEVALAAVGIGQLISGLIEKHKQNMEEKSQEAQAMSQPVQRVAIDSSPTFDSTFR
tara:strand:+ start:694 stop:2655 length:1962 start_codon:yes stop_codon:yes gene_type:complete